MNKPLVFNYRDYTELREAYKQLLADNQKLMADNAKLRKDKANLEIRLRIAEADRIPVLYLCDGGACGHDCNANGCRHTSNIQYAKNFHKVGEEHYYEVGPSVDLSEVPEILEKILEAGKRLEG